MRVGIRRSLPVGVVSLCVLVVALAVGSAAALAAAPVVSEEQVTSVEATAATLQADIDPNEASTAYHFEYDGSPYASGASHGTSLPEPAGMIEPGTGPVLESVRVKGLRPGTSYYYRVVAVAGSETVDGPGKVFTTPFVLGSEPVESCPNEQRRAEQPFGLTLPDCRAYEMVSPAETLGQNATELGNAYLARAGEGGAPEHEGSAVTYASAGSFADPTGAVEVDQYLSRREPAYGRWSTQSVTPLHEPDEGEPLGSYNAMVFTPELTEGVTNTTAPLTPEAPITGTSGAGREEGLYVANFTDGAYRYITDEGSKGDTGAEPMGASLDLSRVVFGEYGTVSEWAGGVTVPVGVTNSGSGLNAKVGASGAHLGHSAWRAVSSDGSRVVFSSEGVLYDRVNAGQPQSPIAHPEAAGSGTLTEGSQVVTHLVVAAGTVRRAVEVGATEVHIEVGRGEFNVGSPVSGEGIAAGTVVTEITPNPEFPGVEALILSIPTVAEISRGALIVSGGPAPFAVGQEVFGNGVPRGARVTKVEEGGLTLSVAAASSGVGVSLDAGGECTVVGGACTVVVSGSQRLRASALGVQPAQYGGASTDGKRVFFTSTAELTEDALTGPGAQNLYECELVEEEGGRRVPAGCDLKDLTGEAVDGVGEGAAVRGVVQISEDGSYVYFVAGGVLAAGGVEGHSNLYVSHDGGRPRFIATLAEGDTGVWGGGPETDTAVVSPDGSHLAFLSKANLTGYDNQQAQPGDCEGETGLYNEGESGVCREAYLYDAETGGLECASCSPSGARPLGPANFGQARYQYDSYRSRNLSDGGVLFFDSYDALAPHSSDGHQNVYEFEGGRVYRISNVSGGFESFFLDASASGGDVFFASADRLLPEDTGNNVVVYDARVDGGFPVQTSPPPCNNGDSCKPPPSVQPPVFGAPASATFSGPGNAAQSPSTVVKKVTKKTAKCRKGLLKNQQGKCIKRKKSKKAKRSVHVNRRTH